MDIITPYLSEIISAILGIISGAAISVPITVKFCSTKASGSATVIDQRGAEANGDIVGRDKTSN